MNSTAVHLDSGAPQRFPVVVVGAGPAGLTVGNVLRAAGVDCLVLETETREFIERRPRAGVIEEWAVRGLQQRGLAETLLERAQLHSECEFRFGGERFRFSYAELTDTHHFIYPQQFLVTDLVREYVDVRGGEARFAVRDVRLHDLDSARPSVSYVSAETGEREIVECDFVAGCDGGRGVTRTALPGQARISRHDYGVGWLALLAEAPPSNDCVVFGIHPNGFAGHMARSPEVTRYYLECPPGDDPENWSHERVWSELRLRLAATGTGPLTEGRLIEKRVLDMHNYVVEPMVFGRLFLAGDAAHLTAPIAAKGMNLALHDAFLLGDALVGYLTGGDESGLDGYSETCLRRVWDYQEFSQWLSEVYHGTSSGDAYRAGTTFARLRRLFTSPRAAAAFAEQYLGTASGY
ncbi:4-hydroxybenzoate 3-monooxygenase [Streptomyces resistomycificus]|uniref:4-hydroxybenzoate 3-monooxygenase n=1 Tax=Streptomyces resistomycificus TaxID=67356 RepID=A0A0L8LKL2_9ACTN|nr:4-hydroxybenzoate 3-monooxygenase [Streptomyces resistomycificus]KOG38657.1 4-hydroxybenzoate 3-monooxygenase [Streptomyces resistomycificus]KUO00507.1 4-hydroxybenzoate 3-monooxygenase [Streptomyces resistomycificus]